MPGGSRCWRLHLDLGDVVARRPCGVLQRAVARERPDAFQQTGQPGPGAVQRPGRSLQLPPEGQRETDGGPVRRAGRRSTCFSCIAMVAGWLRRSSALRHPPPGDCGGQQENRGAARTVGGRGGPGPPTGLPAGWPLVGEEEEVGPAAERVDEAVDGLGGVRCSTTAARPARAPAHARCRPARSRPASTGWNGDGSSRVRASLSPEALGHPVLAFVHIEVTQGHLDEFADFAGWPPAPRVRRRGVLDHGRRRSPHPGRGARQRPPGRHECRRSSACRRPASSPPPPMAFGERVRTGCCRWWSRSASGREADGGTGVIGRARPRLASWTHLARSAALRLIFSISTAHWLDSEPNYFEAGRRTAQPSRASPTSPGPRPSAAFGISTRETVVLWKERYGLRSPLDALLADMNRGYWSWPAPPRTCTRRCGSWWNCWPPRAPRWPWPRAPHPPPSRRS